MSKAALRNLRNVMVFSLLDGKLDEGEKELIESLRRRLDVSETEFLELCAQVRKDRKSLSLPKSRQEAIETLSLLIETAAVDGVVTEAEKRLLERIARQINVSDAELARLLQGGEDALTDEIHPLIDEIYERFESWDESTRQQKFEAIGSTGVAAVTPLLRMFESYRTPAGAKNALEMKKMVVAQIGCLGDGRAAYYLAQQISLGEMEDEVTSSELRFASAEALGLCVGETFGADRAGVESARQWWLAKGSRLHGSLAF